MAANNNLAILGISPRNSYFTKTNIGFALDALLQKQTSVLVFVPDGPDIHNYLAYGYEEEKARTQATTIGHSFRKTVHELCTDHCYSCADNGYTEAQVRIIDWRIEVENKPSYKESLAEIEMLYQTSDAFRYDVRDASRSSLQSRMKHNSRTQHHIDKTGMEKAIDKAVHYVLSEIAFLNVAPALFGREHADYVYHREWPVYEKFIAGKYDGNSRPQLNLKIISNPLAA